MDVGIFMVYLHLLFAFVWVGILIALPLLIIPVLKGEERYRDYLNRIGYRMRFFGWLALTGLLVTGLWNMFDRQLYRNPILHLKLTLFGILVIITLIHDVMGPGEGNLRLIRLLGRATLPITLLIILLAVVMLRGTLF